MLLGVTIAGVLLLCAFNSVIATEASASKFTPYNQVNQVADTNGRQQTSIFAAASPIDPFYPGTTLRVQAGTRVQICGALSPLYIPHATVTLQRLNAADGKWSNVTTDTTNHFLIGGYGIPGEYIMYVTPNDPGVFTYRVLYSGDSNYAPAVSNEITLIVSNLPTTWLPLTWP